MFQIASPLRQAVLPAVTLSLSAALLAGCTVGPDWHGPPAAAPDAAKRGAFIRAGSDATAAAPAPHWWQVLSDPVLDDLETRALAGSPDLAASRARISEARASLAVSKAAQLPSASVGFSAADVSIPGSILGDSGRLNKQIYGDDFDASWELDLWGGTRRKVESARDKAAAAEANTADAEVSLTAEVAKVYIQLRQEQATAGLLTQQVDLDQRLLGHARDRFIQGTVAQQTIENANTNLAQSQSDLADAQAQVTALADQLAVLIGREPGALDNLIAAPAPIPMAPAQVAIGDPARLLRNRPDIRAAEQQLAAANADLGARIADRFPTISFTGVLGLGGTSVADAFKPSGLVGAILPQIKWNLFDAGKIAAQERNARSARDEAEATYRSKVLAALEDAEGSLTRFGSQRIALGKSAEARDAAARTAVLQGQRAEGGTLSRADALSAQRQALRAQLGTVSAEAQLTTNFIAVEKALGLGWDSEVHKE